MNLIRTDTPMEVCRRQEIKAHACLSLAQHILPNADDRVIEDTAVRLMHMPLEDIKAIETNLKKPSKINDTIGLSRYDLIKGKSHESIRVK